MHFSIGSWFLALALACGGIAVEAGARAASGLQPLAGAQSRSTSIEVRLHGIGEVHRPAAEQVVREAAARAQELLGRNTQRSDELVVHLYAAELDYLEASRRLSDGRFDANLAFAHMGTKTAHVLLQPPMGQAVLEVLGFPYQTRVLLAHETAHLVRYSALPNHASNPAWFADGFGQLVASDVTRGERPALEIPWDSTARAQAAALAREDRLPTVEAVVRGRDQDLPFYPRYSVRQSLVRFLREELGERALRDVCSEIARAGGGTDTAGPVLKVLARHRDHEARFRRWILESTPVWHEVIRSLWWTEDGLAQVAWPSDSAHAWREEPLPEGTFEVSGRATILPSARTQLNLRFEREGGGFYQAAFVANQALVFFLNHPEDGWIQLERFATDSIPLGEPFDFLLRHEDGHLRASVAGEELGRAPLSQGPILGRLALSAQAGAAGIWHTVEVREGASESDSGDG